MTGHRKPLDPARLEAAVRAGAAPITIRRDHHLPLSEAATRAETLVERLRRTFTLECRWQGVGAWRGHRLLFEVPSGLGAGTYGCVDVDAGYAYVQIVIPSGYALFRGVVESEVRRSMDELL